MASEVVMPRLGWGGEEGSLVEWVKQDGDFVRAGEVICRVEGDKAVSEVEALDSGVLRIPADSPQPGSKVPVGTVLAYLVAAESVARGREERIDAVPATPAIARSSSVVSAPPAVMTVALDQPPDTTVQLELLVQMVRIRRTEEQLARLHAAGLVHGACHTYVGEEAVATGVCAHLRTEDTVLSTHRGHGHALAKGVPPRALIAELLGRVTGCSHGRGGSMHIFSPEVGMLGTSGIVGPSILMATGAAYGYKLLKQDRVSVAFFGDGASNNGAFQEGVNLATIWKLPVLFVCENNQYATEVPFASVAGNPNVAERGAGYGIPSYRLDGNDVLAVYAAAGEAVRRARSGEGPTLLECVTYRTRPHSEGMRDAGYRSREEVEAWRERCPIKRLRERLIESGAAADDLDRLEAGIQAEVLEAAEFAQNSPWPDPATATDHIYSSQERGSDA